ncbi:MAG: hydroxyethylthiazole kinase [Pseudomonadota bacterium]
MSHTLLETLFAVRAAQPLVQCITNYVAMNVAANTLLAVGASPAMVHDKKEAAEFATLADALTVNIGTPSEPWVAGMIDAVESARGAGRPWVLDPVAVGATRYRRDVVARLMERAPDVVRGNASEILALSGSSSAGRGPDTGDSVDLARDAADAFARRHACVVAVTGPVDYVTDGKRSVLIAGGSPLMPSVTALGCALTALVGAFVAVIPDRFDATVAALSCFAAAGARAGQQAGGPGSFGWRFTDALAGLDAEMMAEGVRVTAFSRGEFVS